MPRERSRLERRRAYDLGMNMSGSGSFTSTWTRRRVSGPLAFLSEHRFLADESARFLKVERKPRPVSYGTSVLSMSCP